MVKVHDGPATVTEIWPWSGLMPYFGSQDTCLRDNVLATLVDWGRRLGQADDRSGLLGSLLPG